ncbi:MULTISPECIES: intradiol ring-cleavage dioxygenase [Protofrankia]|uniref:Intradiol ring-cleavage dioxygenase n=1 Tax=Protofrankia coriariae TaxID=1562887 RepID=A0ABR5EYY2_9ACTN|nr:MULTISPECIES: intradiol ring-cleavage dioxygenase [Protofrankia]KLL09658.1 intradiol ring-cleavage dioxygenase [Protofrankia coriariae]ONH32341.1 intradiol ring-cleavage dioxygenase [Protofrankia sp. BMG5.30]
MAETVRGQELLIPTPECRCNGTPPTPEQTEGPYYKPCTPYKTNFRNDVGTGTPMVLSGRVVGLDGKPVGGTLLDFWQVGDEGVYDEEGFTLRGHQFADTAGNWRLETVLPAVYPGRTRHVHVKVQPPGGAVLTTMLYFPGERRNRLDRHFRPECLMNVRETAEGWEGSFTFVLPV